MRHSTPSPFYSILPPPLHHHRQQLLILLFPLPPASQPVISTATQDNLQPRPRRAARRSRSAFVYCAITDFIAPSPLPPQALAPYRSFLPIQHSLGWRYSSSSSMRKHWREEIKPRRINRTNSHDLVIYLAMNAIYWTSWMWNVTGRRSYEILSFTSLPSSFRNDSFCKNGNCKGLACRSIKM